jgi:hypothetical protein
LADCYDRRSVGTVLPRTVKGGAVLGQQELLNKLAQIEEHAKYTLDELPTLTRERLRMIIALCGYLRTEVSQVRLVPEKTFIDSEDPRSLGI